MPTSVFFHHHASPVGPLLLLSDGEALTGLYTPKLRLARPAGADAVADPSPFRRVIDELDAYFAGELSTFETSVKFSGSRFQEAVWTALSAIPHGITISYRELATNIGNPRAVRAVGAANGQNPISIIVPCHRVVGSNGDLVGYGGGLDCKRWLLAHERAVAPRGARWKEDYGCSAARAAAVVR